MSIPRPTSRLVLILGLILASTSPVAAQSEPEFVPYVNDIQVFDQPDLSPYGQGVRPAEGWYGSAEYLSWTQAGVPRTTVGQPGAVNVFNSGASTLDTGNLILGITVFGYSDAIIRVVETTTGGVTTAVQNTVRAFGSTFVIPGGIPSGVNFGQITNGALQQTSSLDTSFVNAPDFTGGGRGEFGRMIDDRGWFVSGFGWNSTQSLQASNASVNFANPPVGFVDVRSPTGFTADGFDDDLDGDGVFGRNGRDRGAPGVFSGITIYSGFPDGIPDPEPAGTPMEVDYDDAVALPTRFAAVTLQDRLSLYSLETMRSYRFPMGRRGGVWEGFYGLRGMNVNNQFIFNGITGAANSFDTYFNTNAQNYLLAAQFGGRVFHQRGRWQTSFEGRGFLGGNFQHVVQTGQMGDPGLGNNGAGGAVNMQSPSAFSRRVNQTEFAPGAEMRLDARYQIFRSLFVNVGYSGLYVQNVARGAEMTDYRLPVLGLLEGNNKSSLFVHGINVGVVYNR